jgi:ABC-type multidrug transport system ATPase subunit
MSVSGGERQRISIARAFLKDASILLLDEPTSSVDTDTEAGILEATERLMQGRTVFMIAHRTSTLENCDVRLELREGRLVGGAEQPERRDGRPPRRASQAVRGPEMHPPGLVEQPKTEPSPGHLERAVRLLRRNRASRRRNTAAPREAGQEPAA